MICIMLDSLTQSNTVVPHKNGLKYCITCPKAKRLRGVLLDVIAQVRDGAEAQRALRQLGLDRTVRVQRIGHAVDDAGFQD